MAEITFFVAECMEFPGSLGELRENLTIPEAVKVYGRICGRNRTYGPGIGFILQDKSIPDYSDNRWPLYQGGRIAQDEIDLVQAYRDHSLVKQAVDDIKPYLKKLEMAGKKKHDMER